MTVADRDRWCVDCYPDHQRATKYHDEDPVCDKHYKERTENDPGDREESTDKEKAMAKGDPCRCGCGELVTGNRSPFVKGHNPEAKNFVPPEERGNRKVKSAPRRKIKRTPPRNSRTAESEMATVQMPVSRLDNWWLELSVAEKAAIYSAQFEN